MATKFGHPKCWIQHPRTTFAPAMAQHGAEHEQEHTISTYLARAQWKHRSAILVQKSTASMHNQRAALQLNKCANKTKGLHQNNKGAAQQQRKSQLCKASHKLCRACKHNLHDKQLSWSWAT